MQFWFVLECNDAAIKTDDSKASCQVYKHTGRERKIQGERCVVSYVCFGCLEYILKCYPHCFFVPDSHLASSQDCTTCQGLPWATDRALCGWDWILWRISGICEDKQTATVYFHVCCRNSICLYCSSSLLYLHESWRGQGQQGEKQQREVILGSSQCLRRFYSGFSRGCSCWVFKAEF